MIKNGSAGLEKGSGVEPDEGVGGANPPVATNNNPLCSGLYRIGGSRSNLLLPPKFNLINQDVDEL